MASRFLSDNGCLRLNSLSDYLRKYLWHKWCIRRCLDQGNWNLHQTHKKLAACICGYRLLLILHTAYRIIHTISDLLWNSEWPILTIQWTLQPSLRERQGNWSQPMEIAHKGSTAWPIRIAHKGQLSVKPTPSPPSHHPLSGQSRAGNSLIRFPSELLVFCPKMSEWAIC